MSYSGLIGQTSYSRDLPVGMPGTLEGMGDARIMPWINSVSGKAGKWTITPPGTVDASTAYKVVINGITVSFTTGGSTTTAQLGAGLYAAIRAEPQIFRLFNVELNAGTGVVTLTHLFVNVAATITSNSADTTNDLTIANTVAIGTNATIPFGRFVGRKTTYELDSPSGVGQASLIDANSGYEALGVTLKQMLEKNTVGPDAKTEYPFYSTMNVVEDCGTTRGVWCEAVESTITTADSVYVAVAAGNEGKVSKTSSGNVDISAKARFVSSSLSGIGNKTLVLVHFRR